MRMPATLAVEDLAVSYGKRRAVEGVSLTVGRGEIVALLGANGSGKSTTLRTISGLVRPAQGRVLYEGRDITREPADRDRKSTRLNSSHGYISYAVFCLKKKKKKKPKQNRRKQQE